MEHTEQKRSLLDVHTTEAVVVTCMDFRFRSYLETLVRDVLGVASFDLISLAGGAADFSLSGCAERCKTITEDIALAVKAHHAGKVVLLSHENCGKVAVSGISFHTLEEEKEFHRHALQEAGKKIKSIFSEKEAGHDGKKECPEILLGFLLASGSDAPRIESIALS